MNQVLKSAIPKPANDAVVAGKHGAPLISDARLLALHTALLRATGVAEGINNAAEGIKGAAETTASSAAAAKVKFPAVYASLLADLAPHDRITADIPLPLASFALGAPLAVSPAVATGLALGLKEHHPGALVLCFTRSNRLDPDTFRHTLRTAAEHRLPILYVLLPAPAAPSSFDWSARAILENVPCIPADAQDAIALYRIAQETMQRARSHGGPSLIDCKQVQLARGDSNSVTRMEAHLLRKGLLPAARRHASQKTSTTQTEIQTGNL